jgi:hypothetical protein
MVISQADSSVVSFGNKSSFLEVKGYKGTRYCVVIINLERMVQIKLETLCIFMNINEGFSKKEGTTKSTNLVVDSSFIL